MGNQMKLSMNIVPRLTQTYDCTIDEIINLLDKASKDNPELSKSLEDYFSPTKSGLLEKEFEKYLKQELYSMKNNNFSRDNYIALTLSFQFTAPLLGLMTDTNYPIYRQYLDFKRLLGKKV